jgi:hypothetical protein
LAISKPMWRGRFRPGRRTADPLLVLRHMIDMNRAGVGTKFGVAFMDLSAAYDSI